MAALGCTEERYIEAAAEEEELQHIHHQRTSQKKKTRKFAFPPKVMRSIYLNSNGWSLIIKRISYVMDIAREGLAFASGRALVSDTSVHQMKDHFFHVVLTNKTLWKRNNKFLDAFLLEMIVGEKSDGCARTATERANCVIANSSVLNN